MRAGTDGSLNRTSGLGHRRISASWQLSPTSATGWVANLDGIMGIAGSPRLRRGTIAELVTARAATARWRTAFLDGASGARVTWSDIAAAARLQRTAATWLNLVPAIIAALEADGAPAVDVTAIRFARSASSPLHPAERRPGSVGLAVGAELRITDADTDPAEPAVVVPADTLGMVEIRGRGVISAYLQPGPGGAPIPAVERHGWLPTGDVGGKVARRKLVDLAALGAAGASAGPCEPRLELSSRTAGGRRRGRTGSGVPSTRA